MKTHRNPQSQEPEDSVEELKRSLKKGLSRVRTAKNMVKAFSNLSHFGGPVGEAATIGKRLAEEIQQTLTRERGRGMGR